DDAFQDVFVVVHRRLGEFAGRSSLKTWLFGIVLRVAKDYRRRGRRLGLHEPLSETVVDAGVDPVDAAAKSRARRLTHAALDALDDDRRAVFVLIELEQMTLLEAGDALGVNPNTVASRLRAARQDFERAIARLHRRSSR